MVDRMSVNWKESVPLACSKGGLLLIKSAFLLKDWIRSRKDGVDIAFNECCEIEE